MLHRLVKLGIKSQSGGVCALPPKQPLFTLLGMSPLPASLKTSLTPSERLNALFQAPDVRRSLI